MPNEPEGDKKKKKDEGTLKVVAPSLQPPFRNQDTEFMP